MPATVKGLDEKIDDFGDRLNMLVTDFSVFRAKVETTLGMVKWVGVTAATLVAAVVFQVVSVADQNGQLKATVAEMREAVRETKATAERLQESSRKSEAAVAEQNKLLQQLVRDVAEMRGKPKP